MKIYTKVSFYNPKGELARRLGVLGFLSSGYERVFECFAGGGVRTVMYSLYGGAKDIWANEGNRGAFCELRINLLINDIKNVKTFRRDIFTLSLELAKDGLSFEFVDVDPFGSPSKFLPYVFLLSKPGSMIYITSTDMPTLVGKRGKESLRLYGTYIPRFPFYPEVGLRALIYKVWNVASSFDMGVEPIFYLYEGYAYRLLVKVLKKPNAENIGFIQMCKVCGYFGVDSLPRGICEMCGGENLISGNIWMGKIKDNIFISKMLNFAEKLGWDDAEKFLKRLLEELDIPLYYELSSMKLRFTPKAKELIKKIKELGYSASLTTFSNTGIKTNMPFKEFVGLLIS
ncbi:MAG: hypothetical protein ABIL16_07835 [candidate division WOR-3 bacterium]